MKIISVTCVFLAQRVEKFYTNFAEFAESMRGEVKGSVYDELGHVHTVRLFPVVTAIPLIATNGLHRPQWKCSHCATVTASPAPIQPIIIKKQIAVANRTVCTDLYDQKQTKNFITFQTERNGKVPDSQEYVWVMNEQWGNVNKIRYALQIKKNVTSLTSIISFSFHQTKR